MLLHIQTVDMAERGDREVPAQKALRGDPGDGGTITLPLLPNSKPLFQLQEQSTGGGEGAGCPTPLWYRPRLREVCADVQCTFPNTGLSMLPCGKRAGVFGSRVFLIFEEHRFIAQSPTWERAETEALGTPGNSGSERMAPSYQGQGRRAGVHLRGEIAR